jgi:hypothetical protein
MYGNVREWVANANAWGERRWILGGGWSDPEYLSALPFSLPPADRSPVNGIRLYDLDEPYPAEFDEPFKPSFNDYRTIKPVSDETYAAIADQYVDVGEPLKAEVTATKDEGEWVHEVVRLKSDIAGESFDIHLFLPKGTGPYQVVTYFPPIDAFWAKAIGDRSIRLRGGYVPLDIIPRGGRAPVWPVYYGSYERYGGIYEATATQRGQLQTEMRVHWYADLKRTLDYLATRADLNADRLAYLGYSYGASHALPLLALEKRYDAAILVAGGLGKPRHRSDAPGGRSDQLHLQNHDARDDGQRQEGLRLPARIEPETALRSARNRAERQAQDRVRRRSLSDPPRHR